MKHQRGFTIIEVLLVVIALSIIGFGGYYVWHTQKENNKVTDDTLKASNSQTAALSKSTSSSNSSPKYLTIKEWGVRVPYTGSDTYEYNYDASTPNLIEVRSDELASKYGCTEIGAGEVSRSLATDQAQFADDGITIAQYASQNPGSYFKVGNYYYAWAHDQAACSNSVTPEAQNQASTAFEGFVKNIQAIPQ